MPRLRIFDIGDADGRPYFTMEFVEGGSLAQRLAGAPQPDRRRLCRECRNLRKRMFSCSAICAASRATVRLEVAKPAREARSSGDRIRHPFG